MPPAVAILIPNDDADPEAAPAMEIFPFPVVVEMIPPLIFTPCEAVLLAPPVPFKVMLPPPFVLNVPPVREMPWQAPVVPVAEAAMLMELFVPVTEKLEFVVNPMPPFPFPVIAVPVTDPAAVKDAARVTPLPPPLPPLQLVKATGPLAVKALPAAKLTASPDPPEPPEQFWKVTSPVVPVVQGSGSEIP
jgi:hypothetical protein